ncbi:MAG: arginine--tRNA ligase, partial [Candidatus Methylomirabilis sp.]|nr:arginine--tRNA ligase [Deltaproteobacteria bacterium]
LGESVYARYLQAFGREVAFLENYYHGDYVTRIAESLRAEHGESLLARPEAEAVAFCAEVASARLLEDLKRDLADFRVAFDVWTSEKALIESGAVDQALAELKRREEAYERDDALWFRSSRYGDEKDRVLIKSDGSRTYLASDVAYHRDKYRRGFDRLVNVWGADHHGYIPRVKAAVQAFGEDPATLDVLLLQLVSLRRGEEVVAMGKRSGVYTTLREVMEEVGTDAARFFFLTRKADAALDFDLELAAKHTLDNPVYHVQYVHARIQSVFRKATEEGAWSRLFRREEIGEGLRLRVGFAGEAREARVDPSCLEALALPEEMALVRKVHDFLRVLAGAAAELEPHRVATYLVELAQQYHSYYTMGNRDRELRIITEDARRSEARILLSAAVQFVVRRGLGLLGVGAPERM